MSPAWFTTHIIAGSFALITLCGGWWQASLATAAVLTIIHGIRLGAEQGAKQ